MKIPRRIILVLILWWFTAACYATPQGSSSRTKSAATGTWGGEHTRMEVTPQGASLEFECAVAEISQPLHLDGDGRFHVKGTFQAQGPGPTRDLDPAAPNADFSGKVSGDRLELQMKVEGESESHSYTLVRGRPTRLRSCK